MINLSAIKKLRSHGNDPLDIFELKIVFYESTYFF